MLFIGVDYCEISIWTIIFSYIYIIILGTYLYNTSIPVYVKNYYSISIFYVIFFQKIKFRKHWKNFYKTVYTKIDIEYNERQLL